MCHIAGYAGGKQAAPILLEMLRRQEPYDGDMSTGVATIHEGKLHYRKYVGNVEEMIRETDVLSLPGTIGIAHTRPGGNKMYPAMHPNISKDETMALVTNGTTSTENYFAQWSKAVDMLDDAGFCFIHEGESNAPAPRLTRTGNHVSPAEARVYLVEHYMSQGKTITEAMALACADMYTDNATVLISEKFPESIFALRTTRPLLAIIKDGETYMTTSRFGFPEELADDAFYLPLHYACRLSAQEIQITMDKLEAEPVAEMSPYTYAEAYRHFEKLLRSERAPLHFDVLEEETRSMPHLWEGNHTCIQHARLVFDLLWQFEKEGRLEREMRTQTIKSGGVRRRWYFSLKD